jgi:hypothetical protein
MARAAHRQTLANAPKIVGCRICRQTKLPTRLIANGGKNEKVR